MQVIPISYHPFLHMVPSNPAVLTTFRHPSSGIITDANAGQDILPTLGHLISIPCLKSDWLFHGAVFLWQTLIHLPKNKFMSDVRIPLHLDTRLADPSAHSHDVLLVVRLRGLVGFPGWPYEMELRDRFLPATRQCFRRQLYSSFDWLDF